MSVIPFTDRELQRAWLVNLQASKNEKRNNAHRLLLFYAIECGLKAVLMKRRSANCTEDCQEIGTVQHDINKLLDILSADQSLRLPRQFKMSSIRIKGKERERTLEPGKINQMWRYGGVLPESSNSADATDSKLENQLERISRWVEGELRR